MPMCMPMIPGDRLPIKILSYVTSIVCYVALSFSQFINHVSQFLIETWSLSLHLYRDGQGSGWKVNFWKFLRWGVKAIFTVGGMGGGGKKIRTFFSFLQNFGELFCNFYNLKYL